jgi:hypothetical protein
MGRGRTTSLTLTLTPEEHLTLLAWQRSTTIPAGWARRGRIILLVAEGMAISHIADLVGISRRFVYKWAQRFLHERVAGLADREGRGTRSHAALAQGTAAILHHGDDPSSTGTHGRG